MQISKAGTSNRGAPALGGISGLFGPLTIGNAGFTLIELIVVIMILGMTALLVVPRIGSFRAGEMKRTSRHLASVVQQLTQDSSSTKERYRLYFNLDTDEYWTVSVKESFKQEENIIFLTEEPRGKRSRLPAGIVFEDVITAQKGKVTEGEIFSEFYPIGIESMIIHLKEGEAGLTLIANPLTGRVKMSELYLE